MKTVLTAALIAAAASLVPAAADAGGVSIRIDTPEVGIRFGHRLPPPQVYLPVPVYSPPVVVAPRPIYPAPIYLPPPPPPRVVVLPPPPVIYAPYGYGYRPKYKHDKRYRYYRDYRHHGHYAYYPRRDRDDDDD